MAPLSHSRVPPPFLRHNLSRNPPPISRHLRQDTSSVDSTGRSRRVNTTHDANLVFLRKFWGERLQRVERSRLSAVSHSCVVPELHLTL